MSGKTEKNQALPFLLLGLLVIFLLFLCSWSFRKDNVVAGAFHIDDLQICEDLDDFMQPANVGEVFEADTQQICLWFIYSRAREGDMLDISWKFDQSQIQKETFRLSASRSTKAFYLMKEDGLPLPSGSYSVSIICNGREKATRIFSILPASGDIQLEDEFLD